MNRWLTKYKTGNSSVTGYRHDSPDKFNDVNIIESPHISMSQVKSPIAAYPNVGDPIIMYPNQNYYFPGATVVREFPLGKMQEGGIAYTKGAVPRYDDGGGVKKGDKKILPKQQQEVRTTNYIPPMEQFRTSSNAVTAGAPWEGKPMYVNPYAGQQEVARSAEPQRSAISKAGQVARHPMTAASYIMKGQPVPDYLEYGEKNAYDNAVDIINPLTYYDAGKRVVTAEHFRNPNTSVGEALGLTALDAAMVYGIGKGAYSKYSPKQHVRVPVEEGSGNFGMVNREGQFTTLVNEPKGRVTNSPEMEARIKELHANWQKASQSTAETDRLNEMLERYGVKGDISHQEALYPMQSFEYQAVSNPSRAVPGINYNPHIQEQRYQQEQSGVPFHLNNSVPQQMPQKQQVKTTKKTKQQSKIQHIGSGNFTVMEDADGQQNMYHFNTREEADSMANRRQYKEGGPINYTKGANRPADKVQYKDGGKVNKPLYTGDMSKVNAYNDSLTMFNIGRNAKAKMGDYDEFIRYTDKVEPVAAATVKRLSRLNNAQYKPIKWVHNDKTDHTAYLWNEPIQPYIYQDPNSTFRVYGEHITPQVFPTRQAADSFIATQPLTYKGGGPIGYTNMSTRAQPTTTQMPTPQPQYSIGEQWYIDHPGQYMSQGQQQGTPQQQRDHDYLRNKMYQQEAEERANRKFAQKMAPGSELAEDLLEYGTLGEDFGAIKGLKALMKKGLKNIKKPKIYGESNVLPHDPFSSIEIFPTTPTKSSGNFPAVYIRNNPTGKTGKPTIIIPPELNKEQKILESFKLDPNKQRIRHNAKVDEWISDDAQDRAEYLLDNMMPGNQRKDLKTTLKMLEKAKNKPKELITPMDKEILDAFDNSIPALDMLKTYSKNKYGGHPNWLSKY